MYVVESGEVDLFRDRKDGPREQIINIEPGGQFGELGPMLKLPRSASARATRHTVLTAYSIAEFRKTYLGRAADTSPRHRIKRSI